MADDMRRDRCAQGETPMTTFDDWRDGQISDIEALQAVASDLGEVESQIAPLEAERANLRDQISQIVARLGGRATLAGFGKLEILPPTVSKTYDKKRLDQLIVDLAADAPELAQLIAACRTESQRAGSLRITREKS
jgi:hypothetical protein